MKNNFLKEVKNFPKPLFYNTSGSKEAYKLNIKHLSFAPMLGLALKVGDYIYPKEAIF